MLCCFPRPRNNPARNNPAAREMATVTGSVSAGYVATLAITVNA